MIKAHVISLICCCSYKKKSKRSTTWGGLLTPALKARVKWCLENWGILLGFLVVCGCDVQQDPQQRVQVCVTALNTYLPPDLSLINLIAQIQRQLEWCTLAKKVDKRERQEQLKAILLYQMAFRSHHILYWSHRRCRHSVATLDAYRQTYSNHLCWHTFRPAFIMH